MNYKMWRVYFTVMKVLIGLQVLYGASKASSVPAILSDPTEFREVEDRILFEGYSDLIFTINLTGILNKECGENWSNLVCWKDVLPVKHTYDVQVNLVPLESKLSRRKREVVSLGVGIGVGAVLGWMGYDLFSSDKEIREKFEKVKEVLEEHHQKFLLMEESITDVTSNFNKMEAAAADLLGNLTTNREAIRWISDALLEHKKEDLLYKSQMACQSHRIPTELIPVSTFQDKLINLAQQLVENDIVLAIPLERFSEYFLLPLANCVISPKNFIVAVNVPIVRKHRTWKLYTLDHHRFSYNNHTCMIDSDINLIARYENRFVPLRSKNAVECLSKDRLCLVPEVYDEGSESLKCIRGIFSAAPLGILVNSCKFQCQQSSDVIVYPLEGNTMAMVNVKTLEVNCSGDTQTFNLSEIGNLRWDRGCNCSALVNGHLKVDKPLVCSDDLINGSRLFNAIPTLWSNISEWNAKLDHIFTDYHAVFNPNWPQEVKILNMTLADSNIGEIGTSSWFDIHTTWLSGVTFIVMIVAIGVFYIVKRILCF